MPVSDGSLLGCDHGVTFHEENKLRTVIWQFADRGLTHDEIQTLRDLVTRLKAESEALLQLITELEFAALITRINRLLESEKFPSPSEDWPAVPWPPF